MKNAITLLFLTLLLASCGQSKTENKAESEKDSISNPFDINTLNKTIESGEAEKIYKEFLERRELKIKFNQKEWLEQDDDETKSTRWNMLTDLRENYLNSELNKSQIINLLGEPFELEKRTVESTNETLNLMLYPVGAYSGFGVDFDFLTLSLDKNDKLLKVWVEQH
tara:strand:+ start:814 stop:1314 length:501 start_codon:yes stop_codon:yes gene_type:complete